MLKALENNLLPPNPSSQPLQHRHHTVVETKKSHDIEEIYRSRCVGLIDDEFWINEDSL